MVVNGHPFTNGCLGLSIDTPNGGFWEGKGCSGLIKLTLLQRVLSSKRTVFPLAHTTLIIYESCL